MSVIDGEDETEEKDGDTAELTAEEGNKYPSNLAFEDTESEAASEAGDGEDSENVSDGRSSKIAGDAQGGDAGLLMSKNAKFMDKPGSECEDTGFEEYESDKSSGDQCDADAQASDTLVNCVNTINVVDEQENDNELSYY